jgi:hypothetical protein
VHLLRADCKVLVHTNTEDSRWCFIVFSRHPRFLFRCRLTRYDVILSYPQIHLC